MKLSDLKKKILLSLFKQFKENKYAPYVNFYDLADDIVKENAYYKNPHGYLRLKPSVSVSIRRSLNRLLRDKLVCAEKYVGTSMPSYSLTNRGITTARNIRSEIISYVERWNKFIEINR